MNRKNNDDFFEIDAKRIDEIDIFSEQSSKKSYSEPLLMGEERKETAPELLLNEEGKWTCRKDKFSPIIQSLMRLSVVS